MTQRKVTGDKARRGTDLLLAVEDVDKSSMDLLGRDGQVIEPLAAFAGQRGWGHIQVSGEIERHCAVEETAYGFRRVGRSAADALERLVNGVCVSEDVVGGFPVRMLVGGAETRYPERRRISECSTEIGGSGPIARCHCEGIDDFGRIIAEKALRQRHVIRPIAGFVAGRE